MLVTCQKFGDLLIIETHVPQSHNQIIQSVRPQARKWSALQNKLSK